jgi:tight adherence protein B
MTWLSLKVLAAALLAIAVGLFAHQFSATRRFPGAAALAQYIDSLDELYVRSFVSGSGRATVKVQALLIVLVGVASAVLAEPLLLLAWIVVLAAPTVRLRSVERKRSAACDAQAGAFCVTLANLLRTIPNIQTALEASVASTKAPLADELRLALVEVALGNPLDAALLNTAARVKSKGLDACVSALLVGYQVGGNLPKLLETAAATLREMDRLDGVVQSKTAEGRAQLGVLALLPGAILVSFNLASPGYFAPLQEQFVGQLVLAVAAVLWISALFLARTILMVDI